MDGGSYYIYIFFIDFTVIFKLLFTVYAHMPDMQNGYTQNPLDDTHSFPLLPHPGVSASYQHSPPCRMCETQWLCRHSHRSECVSGCHVHRWCCMEPIRPTLPHILKTGREKNMDQREIAERLEKQNYGVIY